jgi:ABC-type transport system substrate-binding protein
MDERSLVMRLSEPRLDLRAQLAFIFIANPAVLSAQLETYGTDVGALRDAGSGPFRVTDFQPGQYAEFERVEGFFEEAFLDRFRMQLTPDPSARFLALQSGQVQAAAGLSKADYDAVVDDPSFRTHASDLYANIFVGINKDRTPEIQDVRVREALLRALNRPAYAQSFWGQGLAEPSTQVALAPVTLGYNPALELVSYDPERARALLNEAGIQDLTLRIIDPPAFDSVPELAAMLEAMAGDLAEVGVTLEITLTDIPGWLSGQLDHDLTVAPFTNSTRDPDGVIPLYFDRPPARYQIPEEQVYRELVDEATVALSPEAKEETIQQILALAAENVSGIPIAYTGTAVVSTPKVHNISVEGSQHQVWIEE